MACIEPVTNKKYTLEHHSTVPITKPTTLKTIELPIEKLLVVGRSPSCDIHLSSSDKKVTLGVSRKHAQIRILNGKVSVQDIDSFNGVLINRIRISPKVFYEIKNGDIVQFGGANRTNAGETCSGPDVEFSYQLRVVDPLDNSINLNSSQSCLADVDDNMVATQCDDSEPSPTMHVTKTGDNTEIVTEGNHQLLTTKRPSVETCTLANRTSLQPQPDEVTTSSPVEPQYESSTDDVQFVAAEPKVAGSSTKDQDSIDTNAELNQLEFTVKQLRSDVSQLTMAREDIRKRLQRESNLRQQLQDSLEECFSCAICLELPTNPCTLSCSHVFCTNCWQGWEQKTKKNNPKTKVECPSCRTHVKVKPSTALPIANAITILKTALEQPLPVIEETTETSKLTESTTVGKLPESNCDELSQVEYAKRSTICPILKSLADSKQVSIHEVRSATPAAAAAADGDNVIWQLTYNPHR